MQAMPLPVTEHVLKTPRHTTAYLSCGADAAPAIIFVHGWPELAASWRHQLPVFGALGFRAIAPDMRGYGRSSVHHRHEDYALEETVADMMELLDSLGRQHAVWVGHNWGSPVVWSLASHHPERCRAIANLCVPYIAQGLAPVNIVPLVDRTVYPESEFPAGQWEYMLFYEQNFAKAQAAFEANVADTVKAIFRAGNPSGQGKPARTALVRRDGGWFGGRQVPDLPIDGSILTEEGFHKYVAALERNGFFGPDSWYMNHQRNVAFASHAKNGGKLDLPVLFLHAAFDYTCQTVTSRLAEPMRRDCSDLTEAVVQSGHWMAQEKPAAVNAALAQWLATNVSDFWPRAA
jgi:pimeloyl-ACP methyl ester carboxylesterase